MESGEVKAIVNRMINHFEGHYLKTSSEKRRAEMVKFSMCANHLKTIYLAHGGKEMPKDDETICGIPMHVARGLIKKALIFGAVSVYFYGRSPSKKKLIKPTNGEPLTRKQVEHNQSVPLDDKDYELRHGIANAATEDLEQATKNIFKHYGHNLSQEAMVREAAESWKGYEDKCLNEELNGPDDSEEEEILTKADAENIDKVLDKKRKQAKDEPNIGESSTKGVVKW